MTKWIIPILSLAFTAMLLMVAHESSAKSINLASKGKKVVCKWGKIKRSGATQYEARDRVANACLDQHLNNFERRGGIDKMGDEQGDMIVNSCVNDTICS